MRELPILFSGPMVKAIMEGWKTQTRRVINPQPYSSTAAVVPFGETEWVSRDVDGIHNANIRLRFKPRFLVGDRLWVKETWWASDGKAYYRAHYGAGEYPQAMDIDDGDHWKSGRFMFKKYARLWLSVSAVRAERLQDITENDCIAEGIEDIGQRVGRLNGSYSTIFSLYQALWHSINGKTHPWASNPWVWVYTFRRVTP